MTVSHSTILLALILLALVVTGRFLIAVKVFEPADDWLERGETTGGHGGGAGHSVPGGVEALIDAREAEVNRRERILDASEGIRDARDILRDRRDIALDRREIALDRYEAFLDG